jgi:1,2-diacylglycerol 3-alpha-glucosyltransferase
MSETIPKNMATPSAMLCQPLLGTMTGRHSAVLIFANFGFYHLARLRALAEVLPVTAIELAAEQKLYGWRADKAGYDIITLHGGAFEERRSFRVRLRLILSLWRVLNTIRPRALLIPGYSDVCCLAAAVWARMRHARTVLMFETTEIDQPRVRAKELVKTALVKLLFDFGFVGGQRTSDYLEKLGMDSRRIVRNYNAVDNAFFAHGADDVRDTSCPADWGLPSQYFLYVGRLAPEKNLLGLLRAFGRYVDSGGTWSLVLVGTGPQEQYLKSTADRLGLAGLVHFAGFKDGRFLLPYYGFAGCFILPSVREPWGLVVNEAMASGLPVLVSIVCGCTPELVSPGVNGYSFAPGDERDLAERLLRLASLPKESMVAMGLASRRIVSAFSPAKWAESAVEALARSDSHG